MRAARGLGMATADECVFSAEAQVTVLAPKL